MVKRLFLTPPSLPATTAKRCIEIPNSREWLGIFNAALLLTAQAHNYEQVNDTDLTALEVAELCYDIYVQYLSGECHDMSCICELRWNPNTQLFETSPDGVTWTPVEQGPWEATPEEPYAPRPDAAPGANDEERRCIASANAALGINAFYLETYVAVSNAVGNAIVSFSNALAIINESLFSLIWPHVYRVVAAADLFDNQAEFTEAGGLTELQIEELQCILYCNATVAVDGVVEFDFAAVSTEVLALGVNPWIAVWSLLQYMQPAGLIAAGGINAVTEAECDCPDCPETWCYLFDFTTGQHGWEIRSTPNRGEYQAGIGFVAHFNEEGATDNKAVYIRILETAVLITRLVVTYDFAIGSPNNPNLLAIEDANTLFSIAPAVGPAQVYEWLGSATFDELGVQLVVNSGASPTGGSGIIKSILLEGPDDNPFGVDNC